MTAAHRRSILAAAALAVAVSAAGGAPTVTTLGFGAHRGSPDGSAYLPLALGPGTYLVSAPGADALTTTSDDVVLLVTGVGATPTITALSVPFRPDRSGGLVRLSATRALALTLGPDGDRRTADDAVYLLDRLGTDNVVTPITVGGLNDSDGSSPERLTADSAVLSTAGPDNAFGNADDELVVLRDLGGTNIVLRVAAPGLGSQGRARPVPLSPTTCLVSSLGPDNDDNTADDEVYLFSALDTVPSRTDIALPGIHGNSTSRPVRVAADRALVATSGPNLGLGNSDDTVAILSDLGGANTVTHVTVDRLYDYANGRPVILSANRAVVGSPGPDGTDRTADDRVAILENITTGVPSVAYVTTGCLDEDLGSRPVALADDAFVVSTGGADNAFGNADDTLVVVSGLGGTPVATTVPNPAMTSYAPARAVNVPGAGFLVCSGGDDGSLGNQDDEVRFFTNPGTGWVAEDVPALGGIDTISSLPVVLGQGRAVFVSGGIVSDRPDDSNIMRLVEGIDGMPACFLDKASVKFDAEKPEKGERLSGSGRIAAAELGDLATVDVTVSFGGAAQTLPAGALVAKKPGKFAYADKKGIIGWIRSLKIDAVKGTFKIVGKGFGTGAEGAEADRIVVGFDATGDDAFPMGDEVVGAVKKSGIAWKRPKE